MFSIGVYSLSSRNSHPHCFVSRTKCKEKKIEIHQNIVENSREKEHHERSDTCSETLSFASGIVNELSCLVLSPLETCLNLFQNSIPFLPLRSKANQSKDMPQTIQSAKLILNLSLKSFQSVANLTCHI